MADKDEYMTVGQMIDALKKLDPNKRLVVCVGQSNKAYGRYVPIVSTVAKHGYEVWVKDGLDAMIFVHLP